MKRTHALRNILTILLVLAFGMPAFVSAQTATTNNTTAVPAGTSEFGAPVTTTYTLLEPLPCIAGTGNNCTAGSSISNINIQTYIVYVFKLMVALAVLAAVVMCIIGGFQYMLSESVTKKEDAKKTIRNAVMGLLGALGSYLILYTINPNLVNISLVTVPKVNVTTANINLSPTDITSQVAAGQQAAQLNAKDLALVQQAQTLQMQADSLGAQNFDNGCTDENNNLLPNPSPECQAQYNQWVSASASASIAQSTATVTTATDLFSTQATSATGITDTGTMARLENADTNAYNDAMAQLEANNDLAGEQALTQSYNQAEMPLENQAAVLNYENTVYPSQANADAAKAAALSSIASDSVLSSVTDPTVKQNLITNQKNAISAINAAKPQINNSVNSYNP